MTRKEINLIADAVIQRLQQAGIIQTKKAEEFLTVPEAAEFMRMSVSFIYKNISTIPHVKRGNKNFFTKSALSEYIMSNRIS